MNLWLKAIGIGLAAAVIVFFANRALTNKKEFIKYDAMYTVEAEVMEAGIPISRIAEVLEVRLQTANYNYKIKRGADNAMLVSIKGLKDTNYIKDVLTATGRIQFREVYTMATMNGAFTKAMEIEAAKKAPVPVKVKEPVVKKDSLSKEVNDLLDSIGYVEEKNRLEKDGATELIRFTNYGSSMFYANLGMVKGKDTAAVRRLLMLPEVSALAPADMKYYFGKEKQGDNRKDDFILYAIKTTGAADKDAMGNEDLEYTMQDFDQRADRPQPVVTLKFTKQGGRKWAALTKKNTGFCIAIIFDDKVISAPQVESEIIGGSAQISGNFSVAECQAISEMLDAQPLPARLSISSASVKKAQTPFTPRALLIAVLIFLLFTALGYFILKTLKSTGE